MGAHNNTARSVDHAGPLMRHLSNYAQETLKVMFHIRLMAILRESQGTEQDPTP